MKQNILFIAAEWHLSRTSSAIFFLEELKKFYSVETAIPTDDKIDIDEINKKKYYAIFFWVYTPFDYINKIKCKRVLFCPMYDTIGTNLEYYSKLTNIKIIDFCEALYEKHIKHGINSFYLKYYPKPDEDAFKTKKDNLFFWQRRSFSWNEVKELIGNSLTQCGCNGIFLHSAVDPNNSFVEPTSSDIQKFNIKISNWFESTTDLEILLNKSKYYIAPRLQEGIGLSFLTAMSKGCIIIAHNDATMNEYIIDGVNGYLVDFYDPRPINFLDYQQLLNKSYQILSEGHREFEFSINKLILWISKNKPNNFLLTTYNNISYYGYLILKSLINKFSLTNRLKKIIKNKIVLKQQLHQEKQKALADNRYRFSLSGFSETSFEWKNSFLFNQFIPKRNNWFLNKYKPDIEYFSVFGDRKDIKKSKARIKIFWTGEDVETNFTSFSDNCLPDSNLSLGFTPEDKLSSSKNYIRYPLWLLYYFGYCKTKDEINKAVIDFNTKSYTKTKFCAMVASHDRSGIRNQMVTLLSPIEKVDCAGKIFHNDDSLKSQFGDNKIEYLKQYLFNVCPENASVEGYTTEKLFQAFDAGCIPIYNGSCSNPEPLVVNKKAIIMFNKDNPSEMIERVKELYTNKVALKEFLLQPRLLPSSVDFIYDLNQKVQERFDSLLKGYN